MLRVELRGNFDLVREENANFLANILIANVGHQCGLQTYPQKYPQRFGFLKAFDFWGVRQDVNPRPLVPAHAHGIGDDSEAVFDLHCPFGPPRVRENYGFSLKELGKIKGALAEELNFLCAAWSKMHDSP